MFDPNANPEAVAARAAELALEQMERLRYLMRKHPDDTQRHQDFFKRNFEINISNQIAKLLCGYAVLKGYVTEAEANR